MLSISLLGEPRLLLGGVPLEVPRRKSRAVVYYVAAQSRPVTRERLLTLLWPDLDRPSAQQSLRATLHGLRRTLGPALLADGSSLALAPDVEVDVRAFESGLAAPGPDPDGLAAVLGLYRGSFLDGFALPDSPAFDDWVTAERERLSRLMVRGLVALAERHEQRGAYAAALEALDRALTFEPLQEDLHRAAMRLHHLAGDRPGAIRRYERLRQLLDDELGVPPMAETRDLYDAIIGDTLPASSARPPATRVAGRHERPPAAEPAARRLPFTGRDAELQALRTLAASGTRKLALVEGEPGIGKTRLAEEFVAQSGALAVAGVAHELESALPYQPIAEALRGLLSRPEWQLDLRAGLAPVWRAELARLLPELAAADAPPPAGRAAEESRLWEAVNQLLLAVARQHPVVVFLDDLHWADTATLRLLGYLLRQAAGAPVCFLGTTRPFAPRSPLATLTQALSREGRLLRLALARLSGDDVARIARELSPRHAHPLADWLGRTSEGNPYVLAELVRHARENHLLLPDGTVNLDALAASPVVPRTVYGLIQSRLAQLSEEGRRLLDAAVAVGREFEFEVIGRAAGLAEDAALDALDELRAAGLVQPVGGSRYAFDHSLTMEVAYREMSEPRHRLLHRRVAEALESLHRSRTESVAGLLAWHFAEGNAAERARPYALQAGQQAARLAAWTEAGRFYEQALAASDGARRLSVLMALGEVRLQAGQSVQASETLREAVELAHALGDRAGLDSARLALARSLLPQARYAEATALAQQVRESGVAESAVAAEFVWGTALSLEGADLAEAAAHLRAAEALCAECLPTDLARLAEIKFELGSIAAQQGDLDQAIALYRESLSAARDAEDPEATLSRVVLAHNNLAYHLHLLGDPTAPEHALAGLSLAREKGLLWLEPYLLSTLGEIALARGDLDTAEGHFRDGLAMAERLSIPERIAGLTANLGLAALERGETPLAIHRLSTALAQADALGTCHLAAQIRIWLAPLLPPAEGRARLAEARAIAEAGGRRRLLDEVSRLEAELPTA